MSKRTPGQLRRVPTGWTDAVMICRKCGKKLDGGFGEDGEESLRHAMRAALKVAGRRGSVGLLDAGCFGLCPKGGVTVAVASRPGELLVVPEGMAAGTVLGLLGGSNTP